MPELARRFKARYRRVPLQRPVRAQTPNELADAKRSADANRLETHTSIGSAGDDARERAYGAASCNGGTTKDANGADSDGACSLRERAQHTALAVDRNACHRVCRREHGGCEKREFPRLSMCDARALTLKLTGARHGREAEGKSAISRVRVERHVRPMHGAYRFLPADELRTLEELEEPLDFLYEEALDRLLPIT
jgi:hypothetical protein